jgi:hypothetical protein
MLGLDAVLPLPRRVVLCRACQVENHGKTVVVVTNDND